MAWPKVTLVECPRGGHNMVVEDGFCEHCAEADMEAEADRRRELDEIDEAYRCAHGRFSEDCDECLAVTP